MDFAFWAVVLGLPALAIPPIIHLLNRRRFETVDWGAMQFLKIGEVTRRRIMIEELLLMALRMGLILVLLFAFAAPALTESTLRGMSSLTGKLAGRGGRPNYDFVLVFDGSASMSYTPGEDGVSLHESARKWAMDFLNELIPGDRVAVLRAGQRTSEYQPEPILELERVRDSIAKLPEPAGGADWPTAVARAHALLSTSKRPEKAIILLGDGQRYGWAHREAIEYWALVGGKLGLTKTGTEAKGRPKLYYVNLDPERSPTDEPPNWALGPLEANRPVVPAGREVRFRGTVEIRGQKEDYRPPYRLSYSVDGAAAGEVHLPQTAKLERGRLKLPFEFKHKFGKHGVHLLTVQLDVDAPPEKRPAGYVVRDRVPADNRRDVSIEVLESLPVLLVDGDPDPSPLRRDSDFLRIALSPKTTAEAPTSAVQTRVVPISAFDPAMLTGEKPDQPRPRVLILHNVARLTTAQREAVDQFLGDGGGVLVTLGGRVEREAYDELYREGRGWLPARPTVPEGDEADLTRAPRIGPATHPALDLPLNTPGSDLASARFPRFWKIAAPTKQDASQVVGWLRSAADGYPFLIEKPYRAGRVLLCTVPLDATWNTDITDGQSFLPLAHELVNYLARARSAEFNVAAGQPLRWRLAPDAATTGYTMQPPGGEARPLSFVGSDEKTTYPAQLVPQPRGSLLVYEKTRETGVYRLGLPDGSSVVYVVQPDEQEANLTPCTPDELKRVAELTGVVYENDRGKMIAALTPLGERMEIWWWFLIGLIALLCGEVWMTRRMVKHRA
jgi:hypothetical protein